MSKGRANKTYTGEFKQQKVHTTSLEYFKLELIDYIDYYNNLKIKAKLKGLTPAKHRYQALISS